MYYARVPCSRKFVICSRFGAIRGGYGYTRDFTVLQSPMFETSFLAVKCHIPSCITAYSFFIKTSNFNAFQCYIDLNHRQTLFRTVYKGIFSVEKIFPVNYCSVRRSEKQHITYDTGGKVSRITPQYIHLFWLKNRITPGFIIL